MIRATTWGRRLTSPLLALALLAGAAACNAERSTNEVPTRTLDITATATRGEGGPLTLSATPNPLDIEGSSAPVEVFLHIEGSAVPTTVEITLLDASGNPTNTYYRLLTDRNPETGRQEKRDTYTMATGSYLIWGGSLSVRIHERLGLSIT